jgi:hypothetical protein
VLLRDATETASTSLIREDLESLHKRNLRSRIDCHDHAERPTISQYSLDAIIAAYMLAVEAGEVPNRQELPDPYPEHAEWLGCPLSRVRPPRAT